MVDIWGRSTREKPSDDKITDEVKKIIKDEIANNFNLVSVDPNEIVVFEDKTGKLKTSDISLDSLLIKPKDAADDSIAVFKQNKITAGDKLSSITDKLTQLRNEYNTHVVNYATLRRNFNTADNTIEKFFGKKNIKPDEVTTTLPDIKKSIDDIKITNVDSITIIKQDIDAINSRLGVWISPDPITTIITSNKQEINSANIKINNIREIIGNTYISDISKRIEDLKTINDKVKIPHSANDIKSLSYVIRQELNKEYLGEHRLSWKETITGIYRFSIISEHQFNIEVSLLDDNNKVFYTTQKLNTVLLVIENKTVARLSFFIKAVDANVVRAKFGYIVEYVSAI